MATAEQIAALRRLIAESDESTYTDQVLSDLIDASDGNLNTVAYEVWTEKAAAAANLVDVTEGGSSRKMGELHEQALNMAEMFRNRALEATTPPTGSTGVRIRRIVRP